jgi:hypothetical protein
MEVAFGGLVGFAWRGQWLLFGLGLGVVAAYLAPATLGLSRTRAWRRVIAEHFPWTERRSSVGLGVLEDLNRARPEGSDGRNHLLDARTEQGTRDG